MEITPIDRRIVTLGSASYQANPPYNTASYFTTSGDYRMTAKFNTESSFSLRLYASLPIIYDEWRAEPASIGVSLEQGNLRVNLWDGSGSEPVDSLQLTPDVPVVQQFSIDHIDNRFILYINNEEPIMLDDRGILREGKLWLGLDANQSWTLADISITSLNGSDVVLHEVDLTDTTLTAGLMTGARKQVGAAVALEPLLMDKGYRSALYSNFSLLVPENAMKPQFLQPRHGVFVFDDADQLVKVAVSQGMAVHGHTLVFSEANPQWMTESTTTERQTIMVDHIAQVMGHYKGKVASWDVVNEPLADEGGLRQNIWLEAMGQDYIAVALRAARAADPDAKIFINEYGLEADGERWQTFLGLIDKLRAAGVPLDGVGFQSHIYETADEVDGSVLVNHMQQLAERGLAARISELDVHGEDVDQQASQYETVAGACLKSSSCQSITTWGITDKYGSTTESQAYPLSLGDDLLWDETLKPKPAYRRLEVLLKS